MPRNTFFWKKSIQKNFCFPKDSLRKDNPELNFNPGAADKWIKLFLPNQIYEIFFFEKPFSIIHFSEAQEYRIEIQLAESAGKQPHPRLRLR